jgi:resuscitation-promoting factor RpfA
MAVFAGLAWAINLAVGDVPSQLAAIRDADDLVTDPVDVVLAMLAIVAEALSAYLFLLALLAAAAALPGALGRQGANALRRIALPVLRRSLEAALGGVLLVHLALGPAGAQRATAASVPASWPQPATPAASETLPPASQPPLSQPPLSQPPASQPPAAVPPATLPPPAPRPPAPAPPPPLSIVLAAGIQNAALGAVLGNANADPASPVPDARTAPQAPPTTGGRTAPQAPSTPDGWTAPHAPGETGAPTTPGAGDGEPGADRDGAARPPSRRHVVVQGDTLWDIARSRLPAGERSLANTAVYWPLIHAANKRVIGHDPDLLLPGMRLVIPPPSTGTRPAPASADADGDGDG